MTVTATTPETTTDRTEDAISPTDTPAGITPDGLGTPKGDMETQKAPTRKRPRRTPEKKGPAPKKPTRKAPAAKNETAQQAGDEKRTQLRHIPTSKIDRDPGQPREHFDEASLQELAKSMAKLGQLQPITVRYIPETKRFTLVMGERRWRAARIAELPQMQAVVLHGAGDGLETFAKAVAENVGRENMTSIEEAKGFKKLVDGRMDEHGKQIEPGYTVDEVAELVGKSPAYVQWRIDLLRLCPEAQEALVKNQLPVGLAWYVGKLSDDNQVRFLGKWARGDFKSARDAEAFAQALHTEEKRQEQQGSFFVLSEEAAAARKDNGQESLPGTLDLPEQERERITVDRKKLVGKIEKLGDAGEILSLLAATEPEELALLLAGTPGGIGGHRLRVKHLQDIAGKAMANLRKAEMVAAVRASGLTVNPDAEAASDPTPTPDPAVDVATETAA
ncbi:ParB/RepB/Spo0J family partition protein [Streptomyces canus]|uniref:ParB/RepB/Spo0J family partition protein n=1 Tax=Streptomyces canus TaxID=58343 RepID=UPI0030DFDB2C